MLYTLIAVACVFAGVAMLASLHTLVRFDKIEKSYQNWAQSLSDDCNAAIDCRYSMLVDAMKKDVVAALDSHFSQYEDLSDVEQYIEDVSIVLG